MTQLEQTLFALLDPAVAGCGFVLWGIEYLPQGKYALLRVYIDHEKGITVDDCGAVSQQISAVLDVEDPIAGAYTLEVSSPGLDRPLFLVAHYQAYCGSQVKINLVAPVEGRRRYTGQIENADEQQIELLVDAQSVFIPLNCVQKAKILAEY